MRGEDGRPLSVVQLLQASGLLGGGEGADEGGVQGAQWPTLPPLYPSGGSILPVPPLPCRRLRSARRRRDNRFTEWFRIGATAELQSTPQHWQRGSPARGPAQG